jgi:hypothetical protein
MNWTLAANEITMDATAFVLYKPIMIAYQLDQKWRELEENSLYLLQFHSS